MKKAFTIISLLLLVAVMGGCEHLPKELRTKFVRKRKPKEKQKNATSWADPPSTTLATALRL